MAKLLSTETELFSGQGYVMIAERLADGSPATLTQCGNVDSLAISNATNKVDKREQMTGNRGVLATLNTENTATVAMEWSSWAPDLLAINLRGTMKQIDNTPVTIERTVSPGDLIGLMHLSSSALTVKSDDETVTYEDPGNYVHDADGALIQFAADQSGATAAIATNTKVKITYTPAPQKQIHALTESAKARWLRFKGLNTAKDNRPVLLDIFKIETDILAELALINPADFVNYTVNGTALYDDLRPSGESPYYVYTYLDAA